MKETETWDFKKSTKTVRLMKMTITLYYNY